MHEHKQRTPRTPLTPEELFYVVETKKLHQQQKLQEFKSSQFYKITNTINLILAAFLCYIIFSITLFCKWHQATVSSSRASHGDYNFETNSRDIIKLDLLLSDDTKLTVNTSNLSTNPIQGEVIYIGSDFLCNKTLKVKLNSSSSSFWCETAYAFITLAGFALIMGFFVYLVDKHLTVNGLLTTLGLFVLAILYFALV